MTKVLAISGSLRRLSYNTGLLRAAREHAPEEVEVEIYDDLESLAPYNEDRENDPPESVAVVAGEDQGRRRAADRHARVQHDAPGPAQAPRRLGLAPLRP